MRHGFLHRWTALATALATGPGAEERRMNARTLVVASLLLPLGLSASAQAPRGEEILKRFVAEFVPLTPGQGKFLASFTLGSPKDKPAAEQPGHMVTFNYEFAIAKYEVTQELYELIAGRNPSKWRGPRNSVAMV